MAPLRRYLTRFHRDRAEAEDLAHDAYLRVKPVLEQQSVEKPEGLLYTTARRLAINRLKRRLPVVVLTVAESAGNGTARRYG